ncbi:DUF4190 domain-containing protein [Pseudarthrobacter albicanus]|uniref:DUF4190 domain-containing protein n=1 Tax=Pseudarthrobacter albicanus TaxID=2823873 RepID=UPI001BA44D87|nr:DUF4190 domain-containing protein [Pseudarthrobacter albicanus]
MTDQPHSGSNSGDDNAAGDQAPGGHRPPSDLPPQGSGVPPAQTPQAAPHFQEPHFQEPGYGWQKEQHEQQEQQEQHEQPAAGYGQPDSPYGTAYGVPFGAPGQPPYGAPGQQYGQPGSPYNGYGQPAYYGMPPAPKSLSIASLCCGVATFLGFGFFLLPQIAAVVLGHMALMREPSGRGMAIAGLVLGYVAIALTVLAIALLFLLVAGSARYSGYRA